MAAAIIGYGHYVQKVYEIYCLAIGMLVVYSAYAMRHSVNQAIESISPEFYFLHKAAGEGYTKLIRSWFDYYATNEKEGALLIQKAINKRDANGETALFHAIRNHQLDTVTLLLNYESSLTIKNRFNQTAIDVANNAKNKDICTLIQKYLNNREH